MNSYPVFVKKGGSRMMGAWSTPPVSDKGLIFLLLQPVPLPSPKPFIFVVCCEEIAFRL
jgi:hypothetical protein